MASIASRYATALVMLLIATSFNSFDFVVSSFAPFSLLCQGGVPADRSIHFHTLGSMPPMTIMRSLKAGDFASSSSIIAGLIGSVLIVVASGLFFVDRAVILDLPIVASSATQWNITWSNSSATGDSGASILLHQVQHEMANMPRTVWDNTVFPIIEDVRTLAGEDFRDQGMQNYTFLVDALRPELQCAIVPDDNITISIEDGWFRVDATPELPSGCQRGGQYGTESFINYNRAFDLSTRSSWEGSFMDLHVGPWSGDFEPSISAGEWRNSSEIPDNPAGCPSIGIFFVNIEGPDKTHDDITALLCSQRLELVSVHSNYCRNDSNKPFSNTGAQPGLARGLSTYLTNGSDGINTFPWRVQKYLSYDIDGNFTVFSADRDYLDIFFNHVIYGPNGTAAKNMAGPANQGTLIEAVQTLYNKYMCLVIDMKFRQPITSDDQAAKGSNTVHGTMHIQQSRLKVNTASKLALQIMLGCMTILGLGAWCLTNLRGTLPRNPCSVASTMALLAGSDLCDGPDPLIPENALSLSKEEQYELFSGWMFSLGWWRRTKKSSSSVPATGAAESSETLLAKQESENWRFGIDVGMPERLGFRERTWGRRKGRKSVDAG